LAKIITKGFVHPIIKAIYYSDNKHADAACTGSIAEKAPLEAVSAEEARDSMLRDLSSFRYFLFFKFPVLFTLYDYVLSLSLSLSLSLCLG
jgi:hypothetical protein